MSLADIYYETVNAQLAKVMATQRRAIEEAGELFSRCLLNEKWIYVFGTGHSHMMAEELFYRAGGLVRIRPMLYSPLMLHESAHGSTEAERDVRLVDQLLDTYPLAREEVLLVASNSGRNPVPVELAMRAKDRGAFVIAVVNRLHSAAYPSRHLSGNKLSHVADVIIDNGGVVGDACVAVPTTDLRAGAASTVTGAAILQMIACAAVDKAMALGWRPVFFSSCNADAGVDDMNAKLVKSLRSDVRHL